MRAEGAPYTRIENLTNTVDGKLHVITLASAPYAFGVTVNPLTVSRIDSLIELNVQDATDTIDPDISLAAIYLTKPGGRVLQATVLDKTDSTLQPAVDSVYRKQVIDKVLSFICFVEENKQVEFTLRVTGYTQLDTGETSLMTDGKIEIQQSMQDNPFAGYAVSGYDLNARRVNYNRRVAA